MARPKAPKRPASELADANTNTERPAKQQKATKLCQICCAEVSSFMGSPHGCSRKHGPDERACSECWEAHLSLEVEIKQRDRIQCLFCTSGVGDKDFERLARVGTLERCELKMRDSTSRKCQYRCQGTDSGLQGFSRERDGRIFTCKLCHFRTCVECDRPEHTGETCEQYKARVTHNAKHSAEEAATAAAFKKCPSCATIFVLEGGCGYVPCEACGHRFCEHCMIPWVGENSAYLGGKQAHGVGCNYESRDTESGHSLQRRFEMDEATKQRVADRKAQRVEKKAERERKKEAAS